MIGERSRYKSCDQPPPGNHLATFLDLPSAPTAQKSLPLSCLASRSEGAEGLPRWVTSCVPRSAASGRRQAWIFCVRCGHGLGFLGCLKARLDDLASLKIRVAKVGYHL